MVYASIEDLKTALPAHIINAVHYGGDDFKVERMQASIDAAISEINGYLAKPYTLPLTAQSNVRLKDLTIDISTYKLARDYGALNDDIRKRYEDAIAYLRLVLEGKAYLPEPLYAPDASVDDAVGDTTDRGKPSITSNPRIFSRNSLKGF